MTTAHDAQALLQETFGVSAAVTVRAPGRVNLVGEHTDYAHLPVLPMAIDRALQVAIAPTDDPAVRVVSAGFDGIAELPRDGGSAAARGWQAYAAGVVQRMNDVAPGRGAFVAVAGDLPHGGGLSSSSAFSVGLMAALDAAWDGGLDRDTIAKRAAEAERTAGVETGGMDQQVIAHALAGHALRIDFYPFQHRPVPLPAGLAFVVASSGEDAPKGGAARDAYNGRVIGMRLATAVLAEKLGVEPSFPLRLGDIAEIDVVDLLAEELQPHGTVKEIGDQARIPISKLARFSMGSWEIDRPAPVRGVALHILSEAERVNAAVAALEAGDLKAFGETLNGSHQSLREHMECSTGRLDKLCAAMRRAGAFGARLTGAGFGGHALAACPPGAVDGVIEAAQGVTGGAPAFPVEASGGYEVV